jgi:hypothetical protein
MSWTKTDGCDTTTRGAFTASDFHGITGQWLFSVADSRVRCDERGALTAKFHCGLLELGGASPTNQPSCELCGKVCVLAVLEKTGSVQIRALAIWPA